MGDHALLARVFAGWYALAGLTPALRRRERARRVEDLAIPYLTVGTWSAFLLPLPALYPDGVDGGAPELWAWLALHALTLVVCAWSVIRAAGVARERGYVRRRANPEAGSGTDELEGSCMAAVRKEKVSETPFGRELLEIRRRSETEVADSARIGEANRIVLLSASAGATVALGSYAAALLGEVFNEDTPFAPQGDESYDPVVQFAYSLHSSESMEAAYRVATWAMVGELGDFFWRSRYPPEIEECARAFHFANDFEVMVTALAEPVEMAPDQQLARRVTLETGALVFMLAAAIGAAVPWDDPSVAGSTPRWRRQFRAGLWVATERMRQLAPQGLPRVERPSVPNA